MLFYHCINSKIHRIALILGALGGTIYVVIRDYEQWQDRPVVTSLKVGVGVTSRLVASANISRTPTSK